MIIESFLPGFLVANLDVVTLIAIGILVEKNYVGRMTTFSNSVAINLLFLRISNLHWVLDWYATIGFALGVVGAISYAASQSESLYWHRNEFPYKLPREYYQFSQFYNSVVVAIISVMAESINALLRLYTP